MPTLPLLLALAFAAAPGSSTPTASAAPAPAVTLAEGEVFLCLPPRTTGFTRGRKESETPGGLPDSLRAERAKPPAPPVLKLGRRPAIPFPRSRALCLAIPGAVQVEVARQLDLRADRCPSREYDHVFAETYGTTYTSCRRHPRKQADRVRLDDVAPLPAP